MVHSLYLISIAQNPIVIWFWQYSGRDIVAIGVSQFLFHFAGTIILVERKKTALQYGIVIQPSSVAGIVVKISDILAIGRNGPARNMKGRIEIAKVGHESAVRWIPLFA